MFERILEQNCQTFDNFNFEFSMSHHNAHYQPYKKAPEGGEGDQALVQPTSGLVLNITPIIAASERCNSRDKCDN